MPIMRSGPLRADCRQEEIFVGGWREKLLEERQKRRFERIVAQLPPLGEGRLTALSPSALARKLESCWQAVERKPMRSLQLSCVWDSVLSGIERQADCLSHEEHELVERALILGGSARIEDAQELEAARALSLRLWASVGVVSGKPYIELEIPVMRPVAKAFAREAHERIRERLSVFHSRLCSALYRLGAIDDRQPQQRFLTDVLGIEHGDEMLMQLARRYLWASHDCMDYRGGVMLLHSALAEPYPLLAAGRMRAEWMPAESMPMDILPEEIPLQQGLERAMTGAMRDGVRADEAARTLRFLCKQGAPLTAMEEILGSMLIVRISPAMRRALCDMYYMLPKWIESPETDALQ